MMAENLVFSAGEIMVIAVAAQFKQHYPADGMVAIPAVMRHGPFIIAGGRFFAGESVVLDVIDSFQK